MLGRSELRGPWAGLPVAWKEDWSFDEEVYRADVERTCKAGVPGIYTGGTTGEFYAMEFDEFQQITRATVEECKRWHTPVMIGVTSTYTLGAQRRAAYAEGLGADAVQLAMPYWMEIDDRELVSFCVDISSQCPGLSLCIYDTLRSKKRPAVEEYRAIFEAVPAYRAIKANAGTVGCTPEGCRALSQFLNVWVGEEQWSVLGPCGAVGAASALVYMNPRVILLMYDLLEAGKWEELRVWTDRIKRLNEKGLATFSAKGFHDTAYDHLQGRVARFLKMDTRSRGPYISATDGDVVALRAWLAMNIPELLEL